MVLKFTGTVADRYARLDSSGKRCDGNSRRCVHAAVEAYTLAPAVEWEPVPDAEPVTKQSCAKHRQQFADNSMYRVLETRQLPGRPAGAAHPHTIY